MKFPFIVAHRGASYSTPENTIPAFHLAFTEQADFIEGDFRLTKDNQIVCIHDFHTKRITAQKIKLDVRKTGLTELKMLDVGSWKDQKFINTKIPTLEEVFDIIPEGKGIFVEIKDNRENFILNLSEKIKTSLFPTEKIRIISFRTKTIKLVKKYLPEIKIFWIFGWYLSENYFIKSVAQKKIINTVKAIGCDGVDLYNAPYINENLVNLIKEKNLDFCVYNVETIEAALKLQSIGVDYITTNSPFNIRNGIINHS
jgi:glycerophosphoryl diester phosphodiesterase